MTTFPVVSQLVGTVTVGTSGTSKQLTVVKSNSPFDGLTLVVKPIAADTPYTVTVYFYGRVAETHTFPTPTGQVNAWMMYHDMLFPANIGTATVPQFFDPSKKDFLGFPVTITITNLTTGNRTFEVYSMYKTYQCNFDVVQ